MSTYGTSTNLRYLRQYLKYVIFILFFGSVSTYGTKKRCENNAHINLKLKINNGKRFSYSNCEVHNAQFIWYNQIIFKYQRANLPTNIHAKINIQPGLPILSLEAIVRKNFMRYQTFEQHLNRWYVNSEQLNHRLHDERLGWFHARWLKAHDLN